MRDHIIKHKIKVHHSQRANRLKTQFKKFSPEVPNSEARIKFNSASKAAYPVGLAAGVKFDTDLAKARLVDPVYLDPDQYSQDNENRGDVEAVAKKAERDRLYTMNP